MPDLPIWGPAPPCPSCAETTDRLREALRDRDSARFTAERVFHLRDQVAIALGVENLTGEDQFKAAQAEIAALKARIAILENVRAVTMGEWDHALVRAATAEAESARLAALLTEAKAEADESWRELHAIIDCPDCDGTGDSGTGIKDLMGVRDSRTCETCGGDGKSEVAKLRALLTEAREALKFYADPRNWEPIQSEDNEDDWSAIDEADIDRVVGSCEPIGGKRARALLARLTPQAPTPESETP